MKGYFYILLVTSVCGGLCAVISGSKYEKYIKYIAALICLTIMLLPLKSLTLPNVNLKPLTQNSAVPTETATDLTQNKTAAYVSQCIFEKFGIKPLQVSIIIDWEKESPTVTHISVTLPKNLNIKQDLQAYLTNTFGGRINLIET